MSSMPLGIGMALGGWGVGYTEQGRCLSWSGPSRLQKSPPQGSPAIAGRSLCLPALTLCLLEAQAAHI